MNLTGTITRKGTLDGTPKICFDLPYYAWYFTMGMRVYIGVIPMRAGMMGMMWCCTAAA
jgi:hypothetical protein